MESSCETGWQSETEIVREVKRRRWTASGEQQRVREAGRVKQNSGTWRAAKAAKQHQIKGSQEQRSFHKNYRNFDGTYKLTTAIYFII